MSLMSFEPFRSFRDLDRLSSQLLTGTRVPLAMPMDVWRDAQTYHVAMDLPGVDADQIDLRVERNTLTVTAERQAAFGAAASTEGQEQGQSKVLVAERPMGTFTRQLVLGDGLDTEKVDADYTDGVLHLTIPVAQAAQPRRITVGHGNGSESPKVIEGSSQEAGRSSRPRYLSGRGAVGTLDRGCRRPRVPAGEPPGDAEDRHGGVGPADEGVDDVVLAAVDQREGHQRGRRATSSDPGAHRRPAARRTAAPSSARPRAATASPRRGWRRPRRAAPPSGSCRRRSPASVVGDDPRDLRQVAVAAPAIHGGAAGNSGVRRERDAASAPPASRRSGGTGGSRQPQRHREHHAARGSARCRRARSTTSYQCTSPAV